MERKGEKWLGGDFPRRQNNRKCNNDGLPLRKCRKVVIHGRGILNAGVRAKLHLAEGRLELRLLWDEERVELGTEKSQ